jgi:hypothetical protein
MWLYCTEPSLSLDCIDQYHWSDRTRQPVIRLSIYAQRASLKSFLFETCRCLKPLSREYYTYVPYLQYILRHQREGQ